MGKVKNLEKKDKLAADFDKKNPANRVKSINDDKLKKKSKQKNNKPSVVGGALEKEVKPLAKEAKKEIAKAKKAKEALHKPKKSEIPADGSPVEVPENLATREIIKKAIKAAKDGIDKEKESAATKTLFDDEMRYGLQVVAAKIAKTPPHAKKILLENSLFGEDQPDICFIIRDHKDKKTELVVDESIMKFEELLKEAGVTGVKTIMPLSKLKKDYGPHNMKLKLLNTYDLFLVESEIAEHTYTVLGKHFIQKRKRPLQIDTSKKETLKHSIENAKRKVSFKLSSNSNFSIFEVGTHKMENSKIVGNIVSALEQLKEKWPGGWKNIMRLYLKPMKPSKISIPIYYSKINPNDIEVPVEVGVKQTRLDKIAELLAQKSKKLRLDRKTKKVVKVKGEAPKSGKADGEKKKNKKDKKRKLDKTEAPVKTEDETSAPAEKKVKKEKKKSESEAAPAQTVDAPSEAKNKKKKKSSEPEVVAEVPKKIKKEKSIPAEPETTDKKADKKKKKSAEAAPAQDLEVTPVKADKKKNKKNKIKV